VGIARAKVERSKRPPVKRTILAGAVSQYERPKSTRKMQNLGKEE
jgi:hypothetical protein